MKQYDCGYSYGNTIGCWLQWPYYKVTAQTLGKSIFGMLDEQVDTGRRIDVRRTPVQEPAPSQIQKIILVAKSVLYYGALIMGQKILLPLWCLGKVIVRCSSVHINRENLALAPKPIVVPPLSMSLQERLRDVHLFFDKYKGPNAPHLDEDQQKGIQEVRKMLQQLCNENVLSWTQCPIPLEMRNVVLGQLLSYLAPIAQKMSEPHFPPNKEKDILLEFARATTVCYATWTEVASTIFTDLYTPGLAVQDQILRYVQKYKEELLTSLVQQEFDLKNWHLLGVHRRFVGAELGLDTTDKYDPDADDMLNEWARIMASMFIAFKQMIAIVKSELVWAFLQRYEDVNGLFAGIAAIINNEAASDFVNVMHPLKDFLKKIVVEKNIIEETAADDYVAQHYFTEEYMINERGVSLLLHKMQIVR